MKKILCIFFCLIMAFSTVAMASPADESTEKVLTDFFNNHKDILFLDPNAKVEVAFLADIDNDGEPELLVSAGAYFYGLSVYKVKGGKVEKVSGEITFGRGTGISEVYGFLLAEDGHMYLYRDGYDVQIPWERSIATQAVYDWSEDGLAPVFYQSTTIPVGENVTEAFYTTDSSSEGNPDAKQTSITPTQAEEMREGFKSGILPYIVWSRDVNANYIDLETIWCRQKALQNGDSSVSITLQIGNPEMIINGISETVASENAPVIKNKRTLVPEKIVKELGGTVQKSGDGKMTILCEDNKIELTEGSNIATVNGNTVTLDSAPIIVNNTAMLPIRFIAETFGAVVEWDGAIKQVTITKN